MDGTIAPLKEIISLLDKYNAMLLVDDAHATGVLGSNGRGSLEDLQSSNQSIIQMGTLGKALGSFGAFIAGSKDIIEFLITKSRPFIYTTALPPSVCAAAAKAIDIIEEGPEIIERLWRNTRRLKKGLNDAGLDTMGSATPIIPVKVGDAKKTMEASGRLLEKGVFIQGIRPPTVPEGASRLRATVSAAHTDRDIDLAVSAITEAFDEC